MKTSLFAFLFVSSLAVAAPSALPPVPPSSVNFDLQNTPLQSVVALVYGQVLKEPFLLDDVVKQTPVTINLRGVSRETVRQVLDAYLSTKGIKRLQSNGVNMFASDGRSPSATASPALADSLPSPQGLVDHLSPTPPAPVLSAHLYRPRNRPVNELAKSLTALLGQGGAVNETPDNALLLIGEGPRLQAVRAVLDQYDVPSSEILAKVSVVEYQDGTDDGAGLFGAIRAIGGKLNLSVGDSKPLGNFLSFQSSTVEAVLSMISQDSRFSVLDTSQLRIVSGKSGQLNVGQDVPILSQFQLDAKGNPVSSVSYRSSGLLVDVKPTVIGDKVFADLKQEVSTFAVTKTSNIDSPTLNKRQFNTSFSAGIGDVVVLGGLDETKQSEANSGLFGLKLSKQQTRNKTTLFLLLQFIKT